MLLVGITLMLVLGGCGKPNIKDSTKPMDSNAAVWDGTPPAQAAIPDFFEDQNKTGEFPESLAGVWEAELPDIKWGIKLEPSGSIMRIVHSVAGPIDVVQGIVEANRPDDGSYYIFSMGPCEARFSPETRILRVKIVVDYFIFKLPAGEIEGRMEDYFEGFVSEEGNRWDTRWFSFKWIKGLPPSNINYTIANPEPLVFIKTDPYKPEEVELK